MTNGGYLTRDQILGANDINYDEVEVPEWGGTVRIKSLSGNERSVFEGKLVSIQRRMKIGGQKGGDDAGEVSIDWHEHEARVALCCLAIVDEHGNRMFDEQDVDKLGRKSANALRRVYDRAVKLSGMSEEDAKELQGESEEAGAPV